tara:strand:- start:1520 stop:1729 length:210 start_codon:yes stop_codon:yes gene_type:complete
MKNFFLNVWYFFVGVPIDLTYWFNGQEVNVKVRNFRNMRAGRITFKNIDTGKIETISSPDLKYKIVKED